jgi:ABC-type branched-subunit amino acid transport system substrate-binding protein
MDVRKEAVSNQFSAFSFKKKTLWFFTFILAITIVGCGSTKTEKLMRVALLAPFEGRYREVGYNAYYAVKLAFQDYGQADVELIAVEDGGSVESATDRARALAIDPSVKAVIALGYAATDAETQQAFGDLPVVIIGHWDTKPETANVLMLETPQIENLIQLPADARELTEIAQSDQQIIGDESLALEQFSLLSQNMEQVTIVSSGNLPDAEFTERYLNSAEFTPQPGLLATLTYDAASIILHELKSAASGNILNAMKAVAYAGINGDIRFQDGYWADAPIHYFAYDADGKLFPVERPVE